MDRYFESAWDAEREGWGDSEFFGYDQEPQPELAPDAEPVDEEVTV